MASARSKAADGDGFATMRDDGNDLCNNDYISVVTVMKMCKRFC